MWKAYISWNFGMFYGCRDALGVYLNTIPRYSFLIGDIKKLALYIQNCYCMKKEIMRAILFSHFNIKDYFLWIFLSKKSWLRFLLILCSMPIAMLLQCLTWWENIVVWGKAFVRVWSKLCYLLSCRYATSHITIILTSSYHYFEQYRWRETNIWKVLLMFDDRGSVLSQTKQCIWQPGAHVCHLRVHRDIQYKQQIIIIDISVKNLHLLTLSIQRKNPFKYIIPLEWAEALDGWFWRHCCNQ